MGGWITHPTCKCNKIDAFYIVVTLRDNRGMNEVETGNIKFIIELLRFWLFIASSNYLIFFNVLDLSPECALQLLAKRP